MIELYLEHIYKCPHRKITVRVKMQGHMARAIPDPPVCIDCGPYQMPIIREEEGGMQFVHGSDELPLSLFVHEHNDKDGS